jgi:hypothetical protein
MRNWALSRPDTSLHLERAYVDVKVSYTVKIWAALVVRRRRSKVRIALVNRRAAGQQCMRERRAAVVLQGTEQRIGIDLIPRAGQITAAIIAAEIVSMRGDGAAAVEDVCTQCAGIQDCVGNFKRGSLVVDTAPACSS